MSEPPHDPLYLSRFYNLRRKNRTWSLQRIKAEGKPHVYFAIRRKHY